MRTLEETALTVRTEDLSVRFAGVPALDRLDLRLAPGKIHGLLGRNGSGKSTLAATLAGFRRFYLNLSMQFATLETSPRIPSNPKRRVRSLRWKRGRPNGI